MFNWIRESWQAWQHWRDMGEDERRAWVDDDPTNSPGAPRPEGGQ